MSAELKACPFCGGEATWVSGGPGCAYVKCNGCPAETGDGSVPRISDAWNRRTDLSQAAVAAVLEAAADRADVIANGHRDNECSDMAAGAQQVADEIRALITKPQHDALAARPALHPASPLGEVMKVPEVQALVEAAKGLRVRYDIMGCGDGLEALAVDAALAPFAGKGE